MTLWLGLVALAGWAIAIFVILPPHPTSDHWLLIYSPPWADAKVYIHAAQRLLDTGSPYLPQHLAGHALEGDPDAYWYPPLFAQVLTPLTLFSVQVAATIWALLNAAAMVGATWLGAGRAGLRRWSRLALAILLPLAFLPALEEARLGNIDGILAFLLAVALSKSARSGLLALGFGALTKVTPVMLLPALLANRTREWRRPLVILTVLVAASVLAAPVAWTQFPGVLFSLALDTEGHAINLTPNGLLRLPELVVGVAALGASLFLVRRRLDWGLALALAASQLLPPTFASHYLVLWLPFLALWLPKLSGRRLILVFLGLALVAVPLSAAQIWIGMTLTLVAASGAHFGDDSSSSGIARQP